MFAVLLLSIVLYKKITSSSCQRRLASTPLAPRFCSQALGFRLVDSRLRGNDEVIKVPLSHQGSISTRPLSLLITNSTQRRPFGHFKPPNLPEQLLF